MKNFFVIGIGGCGNKMLIEAIENRIVSKDNALLINTTKKDIPLKYQSEALIFSNDEEADYGCAKNREASKQLILQYLKNHAEEFEELIPENIEEVIVINSTEGGTGSGAAPLLCRYIDEEMNIPVINIPILGFNDDVAGMENTLSYLSDVSESIALLPISNAKKNDIEDINNFIKIESYVNEIVLNKLKAIMGIGIIDSDQNIDYADHLSLCSNDGLMFVDTIYLSKIKDTKQFNDAIMASIANSISFDIDSDLTSNHTMLGIFMNISDTKLDYIGTDFSILKKRLFGEYSPKTFFHHQNDGNEEYVRIIISGLNIPISEAKDLKALIETERLKVSGNSSSFFDEIKNMSVESSEPRKRRRTSGSVLDSVSTEVSEETNEVLSRRGGRSRRASTSSKPTETSADVQAPKHNLSVGGKNVFIKE